MLLESKQLYRFMFLIFKTLFSVLIPVLISFNLFAKNNSARVPAYEHPVKPISFNIESSFISMDKTVKLTSHRVWAGPESYLEIELYNSLNQDFQGLIFFDFFPVGKIDLQEFVNIKSKSTVSVTNKSHSELNQESNTQLKLSGNSELIENENTYRTIQTVGDHIPGTKKLVKGIFPSFMIHVPKGETKIYRLVIDGHRTFSSDLYIAPSYLSFDNHKDPYIFLYVGCLGAILFLAFYNLILGLSISDKSFLIYFFWCICVLIVMTNQSGMIDYLNLDTRLSVGGVLYFPVVLLASGICLLFMKSYLNTKLYSPLVDRWIVRLLFIALTLFVTALFIDFDLKSKVMPWLVDYWVMIMAICVPIFAVILWTKGQRLSMFYLAAWGSLAFTILIFMFAHYGIIPSASWTRYIVIIGMSTEMLLLSVALGFRVRVLDKNRYLAERRASENEKFRRLTRVLVHDIANPLVVISMAGYGLEKNLTTFSNQENGRRINRATQHLKDLLSNVSAMCKNQNGELKLDRTSLNEAIHECLFIFEPKLFEKNLSVKIDCSKDVYVMAEKTNLIHDVLSNLFSNAIKFSQNNSEIHIQVRSDGGKVLLRIRDQGVGIPKNLLAEFEKDGEITSRTGTIGETGHGFGLGLVKAYMNLFGGSLQLKSKTEGPEQGTEIELSFKSA